jgi:hypothetical protein
VAEGKRSLPGEAKPRGTTEGGERRAQAPCPRRPGNGSRRCRRQLQRDRGNERIDRGPVARPSRRTTRRSTAHRTGSFERVPSSTTKLVVVPNCERLARDSRVLVPRERDADIFERADWCVCALLHRLQRQRAPRAGTATSRVNAPRKPARIRVRTSRRPPRSRRRSGRTSQESAARRASPLDECPRGTTGALFVLEDDGDEAPRRAPTRWDSAGRVAPPRVCPAARLGAGRTAVAPLSHRMPPFADRDDSACCAAACADPRASRPRADHSLVPARPGSAAPRSRDRARYASELALYDQEVMNRGRYSRREYWARASCRYVPWRPYMGPTDSGRDPNSHSPHCFGHTPAGVIARDGVSAVSARRGAPVLSRPSLSSRIRTRAPRWARGSAR